VDGLIIVICGSIVTLWSQSKTPAFAKRLHTRKALLNDAAVRMPFAYFARTHFGARKATFDPCLDSRCHVYNLDNCTLSRIFLYLLRSSVQYFFTHYQAGSFRSVSQRIQFVGSLTGRMLQKPYHYEYALLSLTSDTVNRVTLHIHHSLGQPDSKCVLKTVRTSEHKWPFSVQCTRVFLPRYHWGFRNFDSCTLFRFFVAST
jgi:hypothetical protein